MLENLYKKKEIYNTQECFDYPLLKKKCYFYNFFFLNIFLFWLTAAYKIK